MRWSFAIVSVLILCLFSMFALFFFEEATISNEQDYYLLKENVEAAMFDSIDIAYYRDTGNIKISKEKFFENFTRRFSENGRLGDYIIQAYDIMEEPPKVTVKIMDQTQEYNIYTKMPGNANEIDPTSVNVVNEVSGIIETQDCYVTKRLYSSPREDNIDTRWLSLSGHREHKAELHKLEGYTAIRANFVMTWYDYALTYAKDNSSASKRTVLKDIFNKYNDLFFDTYTNTNRTNDTEIIYWGDTGSTGYDTNGLDGQARMYVKEFGIRNNANTIDLEYNYDFNCSSAVLMRTFGGEEKYMCNHGIIYDVLYKNNSERCKNK